MSVLNYVPRVPSCSTFFASYTCLHFSSAICAFIFLRSLRALRTYVANVLTCVTCQRAFVPLLLACLYNLTCLTCLPFFTRLTCFHFLRALLFYVLYMPSFFTWCVLIFLHAFCVFIFYVLYVPSFFLRAFTFLYVSNFWRALCTFTFFKYVD